MKNYFITLSLLFATIGLMGQQAVPCKSVCYDGSEVVSKPTSKSTQTNLAPSVLSSSGVKLIGKTLYDVQTNYALGNRIAAYGDKFATVWTMAFEDPAFADKGTGYNVYDGTSWLDYPTERIESTKTSWPSLVVTESGVEIIISHTGLTMSKCPVFGMGAWTESTIPNTDKLYCPRVAADGENLYLLAFDPLTPELRYMRSLDAGDTWVTMPIGADLLANFSSGSDAYDIAANNGVIAIALYNMWYDLCVYISTDNGNSFTRRVINKFPRDEFYTGVTGTCTLLDMNVDNIPDTLYTTDGTGTIAIDDNGTVHCAFGTMKCIDKELEGSSAEFEFSRFPENGKIMYWNSTMDDGAFDADEMKHSFIALGISDECQIIADVPDLNGNGMIDYATVSNAYAFADYGSTGNCSMADMAINGDIIAVSYSTIMEGADYLNDHANPNAQMNRAIKVVSSLNLGDTWSDYEANDYKEGSLDLSLDAGKDAEHIYPSICAYKDGFAVSWHLSYEPGLVFKWDEDPYEDNYVIADYFTLYETANAIADVQDKPSFTYINNELRAEGEIRIYSITGILLAQGTNSMVLNEQPGVAIVSVNGIVAGKIVIE